MRLGSVTIIVGLLVVSSCGSNGASVTSPSATTVVTTSSNAVSNPSTTAPAAVSSAPAGTAASSTAFCDAAKRQAAELPKRFQSLVTGGNDKAGWLAYADEAQKNNDEIKRLAPPELKSVYPTIAQPSDAIVQAIRDAGGDFTLIRPNLAKITAVARSAEFVAASATWSDYLKTVCGLDVAALLANG
jgi:hypothetical protein